MAIGRRVEGNFVDFSGSNVRKEFVSIYTSGKAEKVEAKREVSVEMRTSEL